MDDDGLIPGIPAHVGAEGLTQKAQGHEGIAIDDLRGHIQINLARIDDRAAVSDFKGDVDLAVAGDDGLSLRLPLHIGAQFFEHAAHGDQHASLDLLWADAAKANGLVVDHNADLLCARQRRGQHKRRRESDAAPPFEAIR